MYAFNGTRAATTWSLRNILILIKLFIRLVRFETRFVG